MNSWYYQKNHSLNFNSKKKYQHLQNARKKHKNDDALRIEKHRTTLFKNRFNFEQKKNKELRQLIDNGQNITQDEEEEEYQDDDKNTLILNDLVDHSDQNCKSHIHMK